MKFILPLIAVIFIFTCTSVTASQQTNTDLCNNDCKMEYQFFNRYAREGSSIAYLSMAIMNYRGHGRDININLANKLLTRAARNGEPAAQYQLGYFLMHGMYMPQDKQKALCWFKKSARYNLLDSHDQLATLTKELALYNSNVHSLQSIGNNLIVSNLDNRFDEKNKIQFNEANKSGFNVDEIISINANFKWTDVLDAAKQQTCNHPSCKSRTITKALVPRIIAKVKH